MVSGETALAGKSPESRFYELISRSRLEIQRHGEILWWSAVALLTSFAGVLRSVGLGKLGFSIDEGFTLTYSRQAWHAVLGLDGFYSPHPPLSFVMAKAFALFLPETIASRSVSALAGTLTIPVLILLFARLVDRPVALGAGLLLAISPMHIEYSRMGRMYAPVVLLIALAYLFVTLYWQSGQSRWLAPYALTLSLAVYTDYSAAYALAPLMLLTACVWRKSSSLGLRLAISTVAAACLYAPWIPEIINTVRLTEEATGRATYLAASWTQIHEVVRSIPGITGARSSVRVSSPSAWDRWTGARPYYLIALIPIAAAGMLTLRRRPHALLVALLLMMGTPLVAILASQVSPGFATRTVLAAVLGWVVLPSGWLTPERTANPLRGLGFLGWLFLLIVSVLSLPATYGDARHPQWPSISEELADQAYLAKPVLIFSTAGMLTDMVDLYEGHRLQDVRIITLLDGEREYFTGAERWLERGITLQQLNDGALTALLPPGDSRVDAFWFIREFGGAEVLPHLVDLGYRRIGMTTYFRTDLELWARPGAEIGVSRPIENGAGSINLRFSGGTDRFRETEGAGTVFQLTKAKGRGVQEIEAREGWYTLSADAWTVGEGNSSGGVLLKLKCISSNGEGLSSASTIISSDNRFGAWSSGMIAVRCPEETVSLSISLSRSSENQVSIRRMVLFESHPQPDEPSTS